MNPRKYISQVTQGRLEPAVKLAIKELLQGLEGKSVRITIEKFVRTRTTKQNRFMHGPFFDAIMEAHAERGIPLSKKQVKQLFKDAFGVMETVTGINGEPRQQQKSTADYTTVECEEAMEKARAEYAKYDVWLPFPNENLLPPPHRSIEWRV